MSNSTDLPIMLRLLKYSDAQPEKQKTVQKYLKSVLGVLTNRRSRIKPPKVVTKSFVQSLFNSKPCPLNNKNVIEGITDFPIDTDDQTLVRLHEISSWIKENEDTEDYDLLERRITEATDLGKAILEESHLDGEDFARLAIALTYKFSDSVFQFLRDLNKWGPELAEPNLSKEIAQAAFNDVCNEVLGRIKLLKNKPLEKEEPEAGQADSEELSSQPENSSDIPEEDKPSTQSPKPRKISKDPDPELHFEQAKQPKNLEDALESLIETEKLASSSSEDPIGAKLEALQKKIRERVDLETKEAEETALNLNHKPMVTGFLRSFNNGSMFNFYPLCRWEDGRPHQITNAKELYPEKGNLLFTEVPRLSRNQRNQLKNGILLNVEFEDSEKFAHSYNNLSLYALDILSLFRDGKVEQASFDDRDDGYWKAYYVVEPASPENISFDGKSIYVKLDGLTTAREELTDTVRGQLVVVKHQDKFYGPFPLREDSSKRLYVQTSFPGEVRGITNYFCPRENEEAVFRVQDVNYLVGLKFLFVNPLLTEKGEEDMISDEGLIREVGKKLSANSELTEKLALWLTDHTDDKFFETNPNLNRQRVLRLLAYFRRNLLEAKHLDRFVELLDQTVSAVAKTRPDLFEEIYAKAMKDPDALRAMQQHKMAQEKLEELQKSIASSQKELDNLEKKKRDQRAELEKKAKKTELDEEISARQKRLNILKEYEELERDLDNGKEELREIKEKVSSASEELGRLRSERAAFNDQLKSFDRQIQETAKTVANLAFDGEVTAKIMEAANRWSGDKNREAAKEKVNFLRSLKKSELEGADLHKELISRLSPFREYENNEFTNIFVCVAQNFLTVFSGAPGSGKTSMCNLLAEALGLNTIAAEKGAGDLWPGKRRLANRYLPISVEKGWTSKRDLIGYYNPLTRRFESQDPHRFECFMQLNNEAEEGFFEVPYLVLLDEANLSPMEYYFADFMNICDERDEFSTISLGSDFTYRIPDSLRFLATINNDHTTENLSPRLIDRAWIITLPETEKIIEHPRSSREDAVTNDLINWNLFLEAFGKKNQQVSQGVKDLLSQIRGRFTGLGVQLSPRTLFSIENYVASASCFMEANETQTPELVAFDYAVAQKLLPTINGVGDAFKESLDELYEWLDETNLKRSSKILHSIIEQGQNRMDYFGFF